MSAIGESRIAFIGGGKMAEAFITGMLGRELLPADQIVASDPVEARRAYLERELGIGTTADNETAIKGADIIVLAIKPQVLPQALSGLSGQIGKQTLVLSFVAGITIKTIEQILGTPQIVRIMPNTPGQVGEGISVWTATEAVSDQGRTQAAEIVGALGPQVYVTEEKYLDMATALSGSGPAYVFLFIEALADAGVEMGFSHQVALQLAIQTVRGSAIFAEKSGLHPAVLRNMVTSPGGTTAAALHVMEQGGLRATIADAVLAAYHKAQALGNAGDK